MILSDLLSVFSPDAEIFVHFRYSPILGYRGLIEFTPEDLMHSKVVRAKYFPLCHNEKEPALEITLEDTEV